MSQKASLSNGFLMHNQDANKRLSIRKVALLLGIPARVVARAAASGELSALVTKTETGRDRVYISYEDAQLWLSSLQNETSVLQ